MIKVLKNLSGKRSNFADDHMSGLFSVDESKEPKISDQQKQELRAEFLSIMQERFLHGEDKSFNYR